MADRKSTLKRFFTWRTAITESDLKPYTRLVLLTLSLHMNEAGEGCWPSQECLAMETGMSVRRVRDHLHNAVEAGWITRKLVEGKGRGWKHFAYTATFPSLPDALTGMEYDERGPDSTSPPQPEQGPDAVSRGPDAPSETTGRSVRNRGTERPPNSSENSSENSSGTLQVTLQGETDLGKDADVPKQVKHWGQCVKDVRLDSGIRYGARIIAELLRRQKATPEMIWRAIENYGIYCERLGRAPEFRKDLGNFMTRDYWKQFAAEDWTPPPPAKPSSLSDVLEKVEAEEARC